MAELSIFVDESGDTGSHSRYYLLSLVQHDQASSIEHQLEVYRASLARKGLPDIPFHMGPLMNGHEAYGNLSLDTRKALLHTFRVTAEHMPVRYHAFPYRKSSVSGGSLDLPTLMKRDLGIFFLSNLTFFQSFDTIKIYYDNGQRVVTDAIRGAAENALAPGTAVHRDVRPQDYFLFQLADYVCTVELAAIKYEHGEQTSTDEIFFGNGRDFRRNILKPIRRLAM